MHDVKNQCFQLITQIPVITTAEFKPQLGVGCVLFPPEQSIHCGLPKPHRFHQVTDGTTHAMHVELIRGNQASTIRIHDWKLLRYQLKKNHIHLPYTCAKHHPKPIIANS